MIAFEEAQLFGVSHMSSGECVTEHCTEAKVLLSSLHLNGHTLGFHAQPQTLEPPYTTA